MVENNQEFNNCIEDIEKWFRYDTIELLDCVLTDDEVDPQFSAVTTQSRLEQVVKFQELYYGEKYLNVEDYLLKHRYSKEDIEIFKRKIFEEKLMRNL